MKLTNCTCAKKIDCNCFPYFDQYTEQSVSVLEVGNLISDACTFDEYVIDWYRDGQLVFTSGVGNDPDITIFHPMTGDSAVPVPSGTYTPVLRYVVLNGE